MYFAQFYSRDLLNDLVEALGDRQVLILDGRKRRESMHDAAKVWAKKHRYEAYQLRKGDRFDTYTNISEKVHVS